MSTTTEVLNLFKYDTKADKKKKFNINQSLNNNWDKIDNFAKKVEFKSNSFVPGTVYQVTGKIDESENLFRYANGQVVIEDDSIKGLTAFLDKQEELGNTSIFCTDEEWQAEKTLSKFGQCGKYVRDKEAGTLRLPAIVNLQGVIDLSNVGVTKGESLPAHMHSRGTQDIIGQIMGGNAAGSSGAFTEAWRQNCRVNFNGADVSDMSLYNFNASKTWTGKTSNPDNSTYQNNAPVQQEAIQYPYVICVNSGTAEEPERPINNYMVNNPFSFGVSQYYKGEMNNLSWLRSNGQKNYKAVYPDFYNWALGQLNASVEGFKNHTDENITDYDFVINQSDESFILPLKNGMEGVFVNGTVPSDYNLYYFVGETMQNSNLANLGRIEETLVNKVDYAQAARASMPSKKYDNLTLLASGQTYIAPADGWVSLSIRSASASTATVNLISNGNGFQTNSYGSNDVECRGFVPVNKGNHFEIYYANVQATPETFRFVYAEGVANT